MNEYRVEELERRIAKLEKAIGDSGRSMGSLVDALVRAQAALAATPVRETGRRLAWRLGIPVCVVTLLGIGALAAWVMGHP